MESADDSDLEDQPRIRVVKSPVEEGKSVEGLLRPKIDVSGKPIEEASEHSK